MPTYTYRCNNCEHQYDVFQSMKEDAHTVCPSCKGEVRRVIGLGGGIVFKGKGFYVTDYKNQTSNNESSEANNQTNKQKEGNNLQSKENVKIDKSNSSPSESTQTSNTKPDIKVKKETNTATTATSK